MSGQFRLLAMSCIFSPQPDLQAVHGLLLHGTAAPARAGHVQHEGLLRHEKAQKVEANILDPPFL